MVFTVIKMRLSKYKKMAIFAKSIELITLTALKILKDLYIESKNSCSNQLSSLFQNNINYYQTDSVIVPYFTDKNCSGIMNNRLVTVLEEIIDILSYKNIATKVYGTGMTFQKKWLKMNTNDNGVVECIGNIYNLSNETFTFYKAYLLYRFIILLDTKVYNIIFNKYWSIYNQEVTYYAIISFRTFYKIVKTYKFIENDETNVTSIYAYTICLILLDVIMQNNYSELGSRATAMQNTVKNAQDNIKELTFVYNRLRQSKITNELIEILSSTF